MRRDGVPQHTNVEVDVQLVMEQKGGSAYKSTVEVSCLQIDREEQLQGDLS